MTCRVLQAGSCSRLACGFVIRCQSHGAGPADLAADASALLITVQALPDPYRRAGFRRPG